MSIMTKKMEHEEKSIPSDFLELQKKLLVLKPIHSKRNYRTALAVAADLASRAKITKEQADYLKVLTNNINEYEQERFKTKKYNPLEILKFLASENEMSGSDLGRVLGHRTLGPKLLNGQRKLSKEHIRKLSNYFKVDAGLFLG